MPEISLDLLFPNNADKEIMLSAFAKTVEDINDPYAHLTAQEKDTMNDILKLIGQKNRLGLEDYIPVTQVIQPDISDITHTATQVEVLKKFAGHTPGSILEIADLDNISFLLKFNIVKTV
jgi:hypothetical protein